MRRIIYLLSLALLGFTGVAWGASTQDNRADRLLYFGVEPIGIELATIIAPPFQAGLYLGKDWLITVEYGRRNFSLDTGSDNGKVDGSFVNAGAAVRWFPGTNSFNLGLAVNQRTWDVNYNYTVTPSAGGPSIPVSANLKASALVPAVIIGNQWIMDFGLVIGLDWFVLSAPASSSTSGTIDAHSASSLISPTDKATAEKSLKDGGDTLNQVSGFPGILVLTLGWSF